MSSLIIDYEAVMGLVRGGVVTPPAPFVNKHMACVQMQNDDI
jgi:hypothetical protein